MVSNAICASLGGDAIVSSYNRPLLEPHDVQGIFFVFDKGAVPDIGAIRTFTEAADNTFISIDPLRPTVSNPGLAEDEGMDQTSGLHSLSIQLLHGGLTFDLEFPPEGQSDGYLSGLASFDCEWPVAGGTASTLLLRPGSHIGPGASSLPIMRSFMELARDFVLHFEHIVAVAWPPAKSMIGRRYFDSSVSAWLERGVFPPLGLVTFQQTESGEFQSQGLDYFIGQELSIAEGLMDDAASPAGLSARLVNQLVLSGSVIEQQELVAPSGRRVTLTPSKEGKLLLVR